MTYYYHPGYGEDDWLEAAYEDANGGDVDTAAEEEDWESMPHISIEEANENVRAMIDEKERRGE